MRRRSNIVGRHTREGGYPVITAVYEISGALEYWVPAFAGTTLMIGAPCPSIHLPLLADPIRIAQMPAKNLAGGIARQGFNKIHRFRRLEAGDAFAGKIDDVGRCRLSA